MTIALNSVSEEELRVRRLQNAYTGATPPTPPVPRNHSLSPLILPSLPEPRTHYLLPLFALHAEAQTVTQIQSEQIGDQIRAELKTLQTLSREKARAIEEYALEVQKKQTWDVWTQVAQYIVSGSSVALGTALLGVPGAQLPAYLMIASGVAGLVNRAGNDLGFWNAIAQHASASYETQIKITSAIDTSFFLLSAGMGLAGGITAYQAGAFALAARAAPAAITGKVGEAMGIAGGLASVTTRLGSSYADKNAHHSLAFLKQVEGLLFASRQSFQQETQNMQKTIEFDESTLEELKNAVAASEVNLGDRS